MSAEIEYHEEVKSFGYPGNKYFNHSYKQIINVLPPHLRFISAFLGSCAVLKNKVPAPVKSFGFELDPVVIKSYWTDEERKRMKLEIANQSFLHFFKEVYKHIDPTTLIYADPPYIRETRKSKRQMYVHEMTKEQHEEMLHYFVSTTAMVAISAYKNELYDATLKGWHVKQWTVRTRGATVQEALYMNYPPPERLHQYNFLGDNRMERQAIKRKREGWVEKLKNMSAVERYCLFEAIEKYMK
jgi:DNA adenine methylase